MRKLLTLSVATLALAAVGFGFAAAMAEDVPVDPKNGPVFPVAKTKEVAPVVIPEGAQFRVRSGKAGFSFVACNESRAYGQAIEFHCLSWSTKKGWGKSLKWIPRYHLLSLTGAVPSEPAAVALR